MLLLVQFGLAVVAGIRGWGVLPLGILAYLFFKGFIISALGMSISVGLLVIMEYGAAFVLAYLAIVPPGK